MNIEASRRESDDAYSAVVARLNARWRVIVCRDAIQWIVQDRDGQRNGRARWASRWYFQTRNALIRIVRCPLPAIDPSALAILRALPDQIEGGVR